MLVSLLLLSVQISFLSLLVSFDYRKHSYPTRSDCSTSEPPQPFIHLFSLLLSDPTPENIILEKKNTLSPRIRSMATFTM